jgi:hypothetical protein
MSRRYNTSLGKLNEEQLKHFKTHKNKRRTDASKLTPAQIEFFLLNNNATQRGDINPYRTLTPIGTQVKLPRNIAVHNYFTRIFNKKLQDVDQIQWDKAISELSSVDKIEETEVTKDELEKVEEIEKGELPVIDEEEPVENVAEEVDVGTGEDVINDEQEKWEQGIIDDAKEDLAKVVETMIEDGKGVGVDIQLNELAHDNPEILADELVEETIQNIEDLQEQVASEINEDPEITDLQDNPEEENLTPPTEPDVLPKENPDDLLLDPKSVISGPKVSDIYTSKTNIVQNNAISLFFGSDVNWDDELFASRGEYFNKIGQERAIEIALKENKMLIEKFGVDIFVYDLVHTSGQNVLLENRDLVQLYFSLKRNMSKGTRISTVGIPLGALSAFRNKLSGSSGGSGNIDDKLKRFKIEKGIPEKEEDQTDEQKKQISEYKQKSKIVSGPIDTSRLAKIEPGVEDQPTQSTILKEYEDRTHTLKSGPKVNSQSKNLDVKFRLPSGSFKITERVDRNRKLRFVDQVQLECVEQVEEGFNM